MTKKLYRSKTDRKIAGVCGGLSEYFEIDSNIIRVIFIISILFGTLGFWVYLVMWILIPTNERK